ncbi:MAG: hypothetical protein J6C16_05345 [Clostridia bacterium]|nr:hypothetical protein [Clostridia bacterium]
MIKFALLLSKGDEETVLETFETKEEAIKRGNELHSQYTSDQGLLNCVATEIDENNKMTNPNRQRCFRAWL